MPFGDTAAQITGACRLGLNVRVRSTGASVPTNDTISIMVYDTATATWLTPYSQSLGWTYAGGTATRYIDLKPLASQLGGRAYLNVLVQDDSAVDYIEVVRGQLQPTACTSTPTQFTASSSWHVAIEQNPMLTSCGTMTNIPVGAATSCPAAITAAQSLFSPTIVNCSLKSFCKTTLEAATPGLGIPSLTTMSVVPAAPMCTVDPYTYANGSPATRYQVDIPFQCVYTAPSC